MARIYAARQRQGDGKYDMTVSSDDEGWCHALGYCAGPWRPAAEDGRIMPTDEAQKYNERMRAYEHCFHDTGHATEADARLCYESYELDHQLRFWEDRPDATEQHRCEAPDCGAWTSGMGELGEFDRWHLCADHRDRSTVAGLRQAKREARRAR